MGMFRIKLVHLWDKMACFIPLMDAIKRNLCVIQWATYRRQIRQYKDIASYLRWSLRMGIVTRENTPEEIAAAIQKLADDKNLRQRLIDNAYRFCERFDVSEHVRKIEKIYREIMNAKLR
jgi:hypothetical protein